jgi:dihydrofolate reductase
MVHQRKIIVYVATRADGFMGRPDGSVDWLDRPRPKGTYGMGAFYKSIDTILGAERRSTWRSTFQKKHSRNQSKRSQPVWREKKGKDIWMMGGAGIIASFLDEGEIDEFMFHVDSEGYKRRHPRDRATPSHRATKTDLLDQVHRRRGPAALCRQ